MSREPAPSEDQRQLAALQAAHFRGPVWDRFARDLANYGFQIMVAWIETGQVFDRMQEKVRQLRLKPPSHGRTLHGDVAEELACETVGHAIRAFRTVLATEGWSAAGGASMKTFFIGQCLFCFPNVYRRWLGETQPPPWREVHITEDFTETVYEYVEGPPTDPIKQVEQRLNLEETARQLCREVDPRVPFVLGKAQEGYTQAEIADMLMVSRRVIERLLAKHRRWLQYQGGQA